MAFCRGHGLRFSLFLGLRIVSRMVVFLCVVSVGCRQWVFVVENTVDTWQKKNRDSRGLVNLIRVDNFLLPIRHRHHPSMLWIVEQTLNGLLGWTLFEWSVFLWCNCFLHNFQFVLYTYNEKLCKHCMPRKFYFLVNTMLCSLMSFLRFINA